MSISAPKPEQGIAIHEIGKDIGQSLSNWFRRTETINQNDRLAIFGLDQANITCQLDDLFFVKAPGHASLSACEAMPPLHSDIVNTGTLRNSLFAEVLLRHTEATQVELRLSVIGRWSVQIFVSKLGAAPAMLAEYEVTPPEDGDPDAAYEHHAPIHLSGLPRESRLFWRAAAQQDGARILAADWCARAPVRRDATMLVLLRTFNRTRDVLNLLRTFLAESQRTGSARYQHMLKNTFFLILDTSATDLEEEYAPLAELDGLNFYAVKGNNLGGGGNMSQVMRLTAEACSAAGRKPDELLLLDDDLNLSLESLYRHWAMSAMRTDETILTLPVMTKSDPRKMWEDGAFWGRMVGERPQNLRDQLAPRLLRHNLFFEGPDHLDALAVRNYPEYCTFIFFSLPYRLFETLGYPLAIFLRGDDIEYSLRAKKIAGVRVFSNPNLLAWHEPGHSFGQEYMSVMHGILINFTYGDAKPDAPVQFFLNRAAAHLSISDRQGLAVYAAVLEDICAKKDLLDHGFVQTYLSRLKEFKGFEASYEDLPQEVIDSVRRAQGGTSRGLYEAPFLYMTGRTERDVETACLYNPHSKEHRIYSVSQVETLLDAAKEATRLTGLIQSFAANFQELRAHYAMKSVDCQKAAFWDVELARYADPSPIAKSGG